MVATDLQKEIIQFPAAEKVIVKAGPGTGKTFCLIERLKFLAKNEKLEPANEILVLSFSVAASQEIKKRLEAAVEEQEYDDELLFVNIRTFDSFATSFMYALNPDVDLDEFDYDQRIAMATQIIETQPDAKHRLNLYKHILVDEVQDLVGLRASLTLAVLGSSDGGFTLFGDPAQGIYNFLMDQDNPGLTSDEFLNEIYVKNKDQIKDFQLKENFRIGENKRLKLIADEGRHYLTDRTPKEAYSYLRRIFSDLDFIGNIYDVILPGPLQRNTTAILCRTNGLVLILAQNLNSQGIGFFIRRPAEEKLITAWVGYLFSRWKSQTIKKKDFFETIDTLKKNMVDAEKIWKKIQFTTGIKNVVRVTMLRKLLLSDTVFVENNEDIDNGKITISSVHRAKGREFDDVVLVIPEETNPDEFLEEGRVVFVGVTRARQSLYRISEKGAKGITKKNGRWIRYKKKDGKSFLTGIEVGCDGDIDKYSSVSLNMFDGDQDEIDENQDYIWENVKSGSAVKLELFGKINNTPIYYIKILDGDDEISIASTSLKFGIQLISIIKEFQTKTKIKIPHIIENIWVRDVVTEVGNLGNKDVPRLFLTTGLWLGIRLQGLGACRDWRFLP